MFHQRWSRHGPRWVLHRHAAFCRGQTGDATSCRPPAPHQTHPVSEKPVSRQVRAAASSAAGSLLVSLRSVLFPSLPVDCTPTGGGKKAAREGGGQRMDSPFSTFPLSHCRPLPPYFFFMFHHFNLYSFFFCTVQESHRRRCSVGEHRTIPFVRLGVAADHTHTYTYCVCPRCCIWFLSGRWLEAGGDVGEAGGGGVCVWGGGWLPRFLLLILLSPSQTFLFFLCATPH